MRLKKSFKLKKIKTPRAAAPVRVKESLPNRGHSGIPRPLTPPQKPKPLVLPLHRRHACLAGPPANTCSRNSHQNKPQSPIVIPEFPAP